MAAGAIVIPAPATPAREPLPETRVARVPTILQLESVECGAAALAMILAHHGRHVPLEALRVECGVSRDGSKAGSLLRAARTYGLVARGFRKEPRALADLPMPAVLFWNFNHFVVLEGFRNGHAVLNDPALGRRNVGAEEFDSSFTGVVLTFERGPEFQPGGDPPSVLRSLAKHIGDLKPALAFAVFVGIALVAPGLVLPWLMGRFVDDVLVSRLGGLALPLLFGLAGAAILRTSLVWVQAQLLTETFSRASLAATRRFFAHALSLPMEFYVQRSPGEISSRVDLNDRVAETISSDLAHLVLDALTASFFLLLMVRLEATLTLVVVACLLLELAVWRVLANRTAEISQQISVRAGKLAGTATGALANIEGIKAAGQEQALFVRWIGLQVQYVNASVRAERLALTLGQVPPLLALAAHLAVLGLGATRVIEGSFTVGQLVAFQVLLAGFTAPVHGLFAATQQVQTLRGDLARLDDVLNYPQEPGIGVLPHAGSTEAGPRSLAFTNVSFAYARGEPPLIDDFSLALAPGQRVALVGASGSGKSTLGRLAAGLYRPTQGEITFEGRPREAWNRDVLARAVAYVDQDIVLFQGTVRENLRLWNEAITEDALRSALRDAGLEDEILARPGGLDAPLQEGARNLSGGQRQRLEIARALARDPHIIILDEATSALDPKAESLVNEGLRRRGIACLIIAHRLSTVRDVDEVIVLKGGRVIERGAPGALLARADSHYARLAAAEARDYG